MPTDLRSRPANLDIYDPDRYVTGVPHEVFNLSDTDPVVAVVARSSADEWDNIIPYARPGTARDPGRD